jgi:hypothetical protein
MTRWSDTSGREVKRIALVAHDPRRMMAMAAEEPEAPLGWSGSWKRFLKPALKPHKTVLCPKPNMVNIPSPNGV